MATIDNIYDIVEPVIEDLELELVDLVYNAGLLRITIDREGGLGSDLLTRATRMISRDLDHEDPISGAYTLEVSTPGLERPLKTTKHYMRAVGETITVKFVPGQELRRHKGELLAVDEDGITVATDNAEEPIRIEYEQISKARTVFDWQPAPKPGSKSSKKKKG